MKHLQLNIAEVAKAHGVSNPTQLYRKTGLTDQLARRYWHNEVRSVSLDNLESIARTLQVDAMSLLTYVERSENEE